MSTQTKSSIVLKALEADHLLNARQLKLLGVDGKTVWRLEQVGLILRVESMDGTMLGYRLPHVQVPQPNDPLPDIASKHSNAVLCLFSALRYHDLTDVTDLDFTAAVGPNMNRTSYLPGVKLILWNNRSMFELGVENITVGGVKASVTNPARTVADLYRPEHQRYGISDEIKQHATGVLAVRLGEQGLKQVAEYARKLGWGEKCEQTIGTLREAIKWNLISK